MSKRKPVTSLWHPDTAAPKNEETLKPQYSSPMARKPAKDHPWLRGAARRIDRPMTFTMSDERFQTMLAHFKMLVRELQQDPLYKVDCYQLALKINKIVRVVRVGIRGKVFMKDRYLPELAEKMRILLEKHHWKFQGSTQRLCGIDYYLSPDWDFWQKQP